MAMYQAKEEGRDRVVPIPTLAGVIAPTRLNDGDDPDRVARLT